MLLDAASFRACAAALFLLAAASPRLVLAAPQAGVQGGANFLAITPAAIAIADTEPATIGLALRANPGAIKPAVFIEGDSVRFDKCRVDFDSSNFDKPQNIKMYPAAVFAAGSTDGIFATRLAWEGNADHGKTQSLTFKRKVTAGRMCQANGDPHYTSFDETKFDFMAMKPVNKKKCFYLVKSPTLAVQTRIGPYVHNKDAGVNVGAAVIYGKTAFLVDCLATDVAKRLVQLSPTRDGVNCIENPTKSDIQFQMSDGSQVKMRLDNAGKNSCYIDIHVVVPAAYKGKTEGLCGQYDDNKGNDMTKRGGGHTTNAEEFGTSWELKDEEDVFVKGYEATICKELQTQPNTQQCKFPADLKGFGVAPPPVGYAAVAVAPTPKYDATPLPVVTAAAKGRTDEPFTAFVRALCTEAITLPGLAGKAGIPSPATHIDNCVKDCQLGGTIDPVEGFRIDYARMVKTLLDQSMERFQLCDKTGQPRPRTVAELTNEADRVGLGAFACPGATTAAGDYAPAGPPAQCSSKGTCETFGCACTKGFTKFDCSIDLSKRVIPPLPAAAVAAAPALVAPAAEYAAPKAPAAEYRRR